MSSFLPPGEFSWGKVVKYTDVRVVSLDSFARDHNIDFVHVVKSDAQGFDFEVLKGASDLMDENRIALVYFELIFSGHVREFACFSRGLSLPVGEEFLAGHLL